MTESEETIQNEEQVTEEITNEQVETEVVPEETVEQNPYEMSPELRTRYKSAEELENFAKKQQSEADRVKAEYEAYKRQNQQAQSTQPTGPTSEELLDKLVKDPVAFVKEATNDIRAQFALSEFARTHPDMENYKEGMNSIVQRSPQVLNDPQGLEMVYLLAKQQAGATMANQAAEIKRTETDKVNQVKKTTAFVETSSTPKKDAKPVITDGMSVAEMDKILDEQGVGWVSDDERQYYEE
jgi:hypothetical protein